MAVEVSSMTKEAKGKPNNFYSKGLPVCERNAQAGSRERQSHYGRGCQGALRTKPVSSGKGKVVRKRVYGFCAKVLKEWGTQGPLV